MASDEPHEGRRGRVDRERLLRTLTFWLRPEFILRVLNRFQKVAGFDRSIALASGALTATIPLAIFVSGRVVAPRRQGHGRSHHRPLRPDRRRRRGGQGHLLAALGLEHEPRHHRVPLPPGRGPELLPRRAAAVRADLGARLAERPQHVQRAALDRRALAVPRASAASSMPSWGAAASNSRPRWSTSRCRWPSWSGAAGCSAPSGSRPARSSRSPSSARACSPLYSVGATVYVPHLFSTYATRYGVIGAVFAMISALFCVMVVTVGSAAAGREVHDELDRIRRGERPAEDEVRRQWDEITAEARSRWDTLRLQIQERRHRRNRD